MWTTNDIGTDGPPFNLAVRMRDRRDITLVI